MVTTLFIIVFIITLAAFVISVPLNGILTSYLITYGAYDKQHTADQEVDSLLDYFDFIGTFCFFFFRFGWGTILPVEQTYISGPYKIARTILAYSAQGLVSAALAIASIIPSMLLTGKSCIYTALNMFFMRSPYYAPSDALWQMFQRGTPHFASCSPYAVTATLFLIAIVYVQVGILCISMVRNTFQAALYPYRFTLMTHNYSWLFMIVLPLLFCIFFYEFFFTLAIGFIIFSIEIISLFIKGAS
jgi:hypothetical protein